MALNIFKKKKKETKCDRCGEKTTKLYPTSKNEWICDHCKNN